MGKNLTYCPACASSELKITGKPYGCDEKSKYFVEECQNCKLKWCEPMPTKQEMDEYYNSYYERRYSTVDKNPTITRIRSIITFRAYRLNLFFDLIKRYSPDKSILDFGCGEADILYLAKKHNWKVLGVDYSNELKERFSQDGIDFIHGDDLDKAGVQENLFACITMKHVVEHIPELPQFLQSVKKFLCKDGVLAIKTPSATSTRAKLGLANWHLVRPMEHFWGFDKNNFKLLMETNGYEVLYIEDSILVDELTCIVKPKN